MIRLRLRGFSAFGATLWTRAIAVWIVGFALALGLRSVPGSIASLSALIAGAIARANSSRQTAAGCVAKGALRFADGLRLLALGVSGGLAMSRVDG